MADRMARSSSLRFQRPSRADERRRAFEPEIIEARIVPRRPPIGFLSCVMIVGVATIVLLRFFWPAAIMVFAFTGISSVSGMLGLLAGLMIVGAAALHSRLSGRPF
jgi:hypothetical protein